MKLDSFGCLPHIRRYSEGKLTGARKEQLLDISLDQQTVHPSQVHTSEAEHWQRDCAPLPLATIRHDTCIYAKLFHMPAGQLLPLVCTQQYEYQVEDGDPSAVMCVGYPDDPRDHPSSSTTY